MKILIVDDEYQNTVILHNIVSPFGDCDVVGDGREALDAFQAHLDDGEPYDLVLLDIMMPGLDGQEVLKGMRSMEQAHGRQKPSVIIMVTALDAPEHIHEAYERGGCTDYLPKPVSRGWLVHKLKEYELIPA